MNYRNYNLTSCDFIKSKFLTISHMPMTKLAVRRMQQQQHCFNKAIQQLICIVQDFNDDKFKQIIVCI